MSTVFISMQAVATSDTESGIVEQVSQRQTADIYFFINSTTGTNCGDKNTYLISEDQCVQDQELFKGCTDAIVPTSSLYNIMTTIAIFDSSSAITYLLTRAGNITTYETFKINETNQLVNSSLYHISSLEVYQGRQLQQAIEISHLGFSLSQNGSIKIATGELGYDLEDYVGELYRMNLSCSGGGLPESGCLFFKVTTRAQHIGYVTNAKFNCTVLGTLDDIIQECNITTIDKTPDSAETTSIVTAIVTTTITSASIHNYGGPEGHSRLHISRLHNNNIIPTNIPNIPPTYPSFVNILIPLLASVIGDVAIAVILLAISITIMCVIIRFKVGSLRNGQQNTPSSTATASANTRPQEKTPDHKETSIHISEVLANVQDQEGSSREVPSQNSTYMYINLDPDHCHPVKNPAYAHVSFESS